MNLMALQLKLHPGGGRETLCLEDRLARKSHCSPTEQRARGEENPIVKWCNGVTVREAKVVWRTALFLIVPNLEQGQGNYLFVLRRPFILNLGINFYTSLFAHLTPAVKHMLK